jgi:3-deoxy-D-manno-octulosonic-acid transferase
VKVLRKKRESSRRSINEHEILNAMKFYLATILRKIYSIFFFFGIPVIFLKLWWKGLKNPEYRRRWHERFGFYPSMEKTGCIWIHAVSVGEFLAAVPFIRECQKRFPHSAVLVTTTTPTGSAQVDRKFIMFIFLMIYPGACSGC